MNLPAIHIRAELPLSAAGFYEKMGSVKLRDIASSIPGRTIPLFCLNF